MNFVLDIDQHSLYLLLIFLVCVGCFLPMGYVYRPRLLRGWFRRRRGTRVMTDHEKFQQRFADAITSAIEEGVHKGWMTTKQARRMYVKCARDLDLKDLWAKSLVSRLLHPFKVQQLKEAIRARLQGIANVVPLPLPVPSAITNVVSMRPKMKKKA